jgi:cbb3-type cytochrome oxidase maturation protein
VEVLVWLIPVALGLGLLGLVAFLWALNSGQFDDLDGAAHRILFDDEGAAPGDNPSAGPRRVAASEKPAEIKTRGPERG